MLLVFGGSQGARSINGAVSGAASGLAEAGIQVLHVIGPKNELAVESDPSAPYVVVPYVEQMQYAYAAADFAVCRCGAMTCAELAAVGLPAAYVPYPVGNGEQRFNALPIVEAGGGLLVDDADLTPGWILDEVAPLLTDPDRLDAHVPRRRPIRIARRRRRARPPGPRRRRRVPPLRRGQKSELRANQ